MRVKISEHMCKRVGYNDAHGIQAIKGGSEGMRYIRILENGQDKWIEYHL